MDLLDISGARVLRHPLTGAIITPLHDPETGLPWRGKDGRLRWPIMGGADDDDKDEDDKDDEDDDDSSDADADSDKDDSDEGDDDSEDDSGDSDTVTRAELDRVKKRMKAADKRADKAEAELKERKDADKSEVDKATDEAKELKDANEKLTSQVASLKMQVAFLTANRHVWHDPETALKIAEDKGFMEDVVDEDGDIDKRLLRKALDRLAKEQKYLVKSKNGSSGSDEDEDTDTKTTKKSASGASSKSRRSSKDKDARSKELKKRFAALR